MAVNQKQNANTSQQQQPITFIRCPDLKMLYFTVKLVNTTEGTGAEFPRERNLLENCVSLR